MNPIVWLVFGAWLPAAAPAHARLDARATELAPLVASLVRFPTVAGPRAQTSWASRPNTTRSGVTVGAA